MTSDCNKYSDKGVRSPLFLTVFLGETRKSALARVQQTESGSRITREREHNLRFNRHLTSRIGGPIAIVLACACWAIDNNLTRKVSASDALLFVLALRGLGTARTGAYFSTAPFMGAVIAIVFLGEPTSIVFWVAAALMAFGVYSHLTEHHEHDHTHETLTHQHLHSHDEHHQHEHSFAWANQGAHSHSHTHHVITHKHPHFPDIHHRHSH